MEKEDKVKLVIIGGGEDKRADKEILKEIVDLAGEDRANIAVVTTATNYPLEVGEEYRKLFYDLGVDNVRTINITNRKDANRKQTIKSLEGVDCIFFVGGDQLRISSILGGTEVHNYMKKAIKNDVIIAGTSAGASMMSEVMVVAGGDEEAPRKCTLKMAPGMGLLEGVIIDQHFNQRGRIGRLLAAVAQNPHILGLGIDEDTAIIVNAEGEIRVVGSGVVTVVDGIQVNYTNISEQYPDEPLAITNVKVDILPCGYGYHIGNRRAIVHEDMEK